MTRKADQENNAENGNSSRPTRKVNPDRPLKSRCSNTNATKKMPKKEQDSQENGNTRLMVKVKVAEKRSVSETNLASGNCNVGSRKRSAFGDITNAIQVHADRMAVARKKPVVTLKNKNASKPPRPIRNANRKNKLKHSQSTSVLPEFTVREDVPIQDEEIISVDEQCEEILSSDPSSNNGDQFQTSKTVNLDSIADQEIVKDIEMAEKKTEEQEILPPGVVPFDLDEDPNLVSEYAVSIFKNMRVREDKYPVDNYLMREGTQTTGAMRAILVDWLVEVQENFELYHETLYLAVKLVDYYIQNNETPKENLQLVGATCLLIACKVEERQPPPIDDFQFICDDAYNNKQFIEMEVKIFKALDFDINIPISYRYLRRFSRVLTGSKMGLLTLARYILELSLHSADFVHIPPSKMAASCFCLAMKMQNEGSWDVNFSYHTGYEESELTELMKPLNQMLVDAPVSKLQTVRTKYSHPIFFEVAKTNPLTSL